MDSTLILVYDFIMELFTLKSVLRMTGLNPDTVRAWEKRYQTVTPTRSQTGRRLYSENDVNRLRLLAELTTSGHPIGTITMLPDQKLITLLARIKSSHLLPSRSNLLNPHVKSIAEGLLQALEIFDLDQLEVRLSQANYVVSSRDLLFFLIPQLLLQVGNQVRDGKMSVSQEHALSESIKRIIRQIYDSLEPVDGQLNPEKTLLLATPENHLHEFGVFMAAVLCRFRGFKTHYLGPNLPASALIAASKKLKPHAIVLGFSPVIAPDTTARSFQYLRELEEKLNPMLMFWLGGSVPKIRHAHFQRTIWQFESLEDLEKKIQS